MDAPPSPNSEFIDVWNQILVPKFLRFRSIVIGNLGAHGEVALRKHPAQPGERVLDVGCGFGDSSLELARMVGPGGSVLGIDGAEGFIELARKEAAAAGADNLRFELADAQTFAFEPAFNLCFSRFGTMFFQAPVAAMRNLGRALVPGGRLLMVVWRALDENAWVALPKRVVSKHLPPPPDDGRSCGPGPFSMADRDTVTDILRAAGFGAIEFERVDLDVSVGDGVREAIEFQMQLGPAGEIVREAGEQAEAKRALIEAELQAALAPYMTERGVVLGSSSWTVTARKLA